MKHILHDDQPESQRLWGEAARQAELARAYMSEASFNLAALDPCAAGADYERNLRDVQRNMRKGMKAAREAARLYKASDAAYAEEFVTL